MVNRWSWERLKGVCFKEQLVLLQVVELDLENGLEGALLGLTQTGEVTVSKKMRENSPVRWYTDSTPISVREYRQSSNESLRPRAAVSGGP